MTLKPISIVFDKPSSQKILIIQSAISEPTTHRKILEGLIDIGYANAIKTLHQQGAISNSTFLQSIKQLPEHLKSQLNS